MSVNIQPLLQEPLGLLSTVCKQLKNLKAWSKLAACDCFQLVEEKSSFEAPCDDCGQWTGQVLLTTNQQ